MKLALAVPCVMRDATIISSRSTSEVSTHRRSIFRRFALYHACLSVQIFCSLQWVIISLKMWKYAGCAAEVRSIEKHTFLYAKYALFEQDQ